MKIMMYYHATSANLPYLILAPGRARAAHDVAILWKNFNCSDCNTKMVQADRIWRLRHLGELSMQPGVVCFFPASKNERSGII